MKKLHSNYFEKRNAYYDRIDKDRELTEREQKVTQREMMAKHAYYINELRMIAKINQLLNSATNRIHNTHVRQLKSDAREKEQLLRLKGELQAIRSDISGKHNMIADKEKRLLSMWKKVRKYYLPDAH